MNTKALSNGRDSAFPDAAENYGLTKREHFAAMAMQGLLSDAGDGVPATVYHAQNLEGATNESVMDAWYKLNAHTAVGYADALLEALGEQA